MRQHSRLVRGIVATLSLALVASLSLRVVQAQITEPAGSTVNNAMPITNLAGDTILIYGPANTGATLGIVTNSGILNASQNAIELNNSNAGQSPVGTVTNSANITGGQDGVIIQNGTGTVTNNSATIMGTQNGVYIYGDGTIANSGRISGTNEAIYIGGNATVNSTGAITSANGNGIYAGGTGVNTVNVNTVTAGGFGNAIYLNGTGSVTATGTITSNGTFGQGVFINGAGSSTVLTQAVTANGNAIFVTGTGVITANGAVTSTNGTGITLEQGGTINANGLLTSSNGVGLQINEGSGTINAGSVSSEYNSIYIEDNGTVTTTGTVQSNYTYSVGVDIGQNGTVNVQDGRINAGYEGIYIGGNGIVTNAASATITGRNGEAIDFSGNGTVNSTGTITGQQQGIYIGGNGNVTAGGTITGQSTEGIHIQGTGILDLSGNVTGQTNAVYVQGDAMVTNSGTLDAVSNSSGNAGLFISGADLSTVANTGTIEGDYGVFDGGSINLTNQGTITGGGLAGVFTNSYTVGASSTIANSGTITGSTYGVYSNTQLTLSNTGSISGANNGGVFLTNSGGSVQNSGAIQGHDYGIYSEGNGNLVNSGTIGGATQDGVRFAGSGTAFNTGAISGSVNGLVISGMSGVTLRGGSVTAGSGDAVLLGTGNDTLAIQDRSHVTGLMDGSGGSNTITFDLVGITPAEKASLDAMLATGMGNINIGGENYDWQNFQTGIDQSISLELVVDSGLLPLATAIDGLTTRLPDAFDAFYDAALTNPEGAVDLLSGRILTEAEDNVAFNFSTQLQALITNRAANLATGPGGIDTTGLRFDDGTRLAMVSDMQSQLGALSLGGTQMISDSKDESKQMQIAPTSARWGAWIAGTAEFADEDSTNGVAGYNYTTASPTIGLDYRLTPDFTLGAIFNYADTNVNFTGNGSLDIDTELAGLYAVWAHHGFRVSGLAGYGFTQYDGYRPTFGSLAHSSPDGDQVIAGVTGAYDFRVGKHVVLSPEIGFDYTHLDVDSFSETGAGAFNLNVGDRDADSFRSHVGGRATATFDCGPVILSPQINAAWYHEFLDNENGVSTSIAGAPALGSFLVSKNSPQRDFALAGAGLSAVPKCCDNVTIFLNYDAQVGQSDFNAHTVDGGVRIGF
jgi:uncharacterized protein with beta-barrel porin domain